MWKRLSDQYELRVIGIMSGTSCDGVTCALALCRRDMTVSIERSHTYRYPPKLREALLHAGSLDAGQLTSLNFYLGKFLGRSALKFRQGEVDLIGSHGHTVIHRPPSFHNGRGIFQSPGTMQIGEASCISEITGLPVVADFRCRDIAAGGEGAPLVPFFDYMAFRKPGKVRLLLNLGGIANVTSVPWEIEDVIGFDTGPANALLDWLVEEKTGKRYDRGGRLALRGNVDERALAGMLSDPYFTKSPPKSVDRHYFSAAFVDRHAPRLINRPVEDALATLAALTAKTVFEAARRFIFSKMEVDSLLVGGGGVYNQAVMTQLERCFHPVPVASTTAAGVDPQAREAGAFALMAACAVWHIPNHIPRVTGAHAASVLGKLVSP